MHITETIIMHRTNSCPAQQAHPCTSRQPCSAPALTTRTRDFGRQHCQQSTFFPRSTDRWKNIAVLEVSKYEQPTHQTAETTKQIENCETFPEKSPAPSWTGIKTHWENHKHKVKNSGMWGRGCKANKMLDKWNKTCCCLSEWVTSAVVRGQWLDRTWYLSHSCCRQRLGNNRAQLLGFQQSALSLHRDALNPCKVLEHLRTPLEGHQTDFCLDIAKINQSQN